MSTQTNIYVFIGAPGAGKGTLSHLCVQKLGWIQLSTGNMCRKHIAGQTAIGKEIDFVIKSGKLVSDELITSMVEQELATAATNGSSIILDGFPRTVPQAQALCELLSAKFKGMKLKIVRLIVSDDEVVQRLSKRLICQNKDCQAIYADTCSTLEPEKALVCDLCSGELGRRPDDAEDSVRKRLLVYHTHEQSLLDYYASIGQPVIECDGEKPLDKVFSDFKRLVDLGRA